MIRHGASRREFLMIAGGAVSSLALLPAGKGLAHMLLADEPRRLSAGVHLFLDDYLIAQQSNLKRVIHPPDRLPDPIVTGEEDKNFTPYVSVVRDPDTKRFRMWYNVPESASQSHIAYMESEDGIKWIRPHRVLEDPVPISFGVSVIDEGPNFPDAAKRYKMATEKSGLWISFSPDGIQWTSASSQPLLSDIGDIVALARDPIRNRYLLTAKAPSRPEDGFKGSTKNAAEGTRRLVGQSVSDDFVHWGPSKRIVVPDELDEGVTEYYSISGVIARGDLLIGLLKVLRDDLPHEPGGELDGIGYTVLAWTRDGETWQRDRQPFIDRNPQPGTWDRAMAWGDYQLPVGDEVFIYYGGYARGHKIERFTERQLGFARMQRDRYVSRDADPQGGTLLTPALLLEGAKMTINADVAAELRVRACDSTGKSLQGFDAADCTPIQGNSLSHQVQWKRPLAELREKPVQLEFIARDARLYGFEILT